MFEREYGIFLSILKLLEKWQGLFVVVQASLYSIVYIERQLSNEKHKLKKRYQTARNRRA